VPHVLASSLSILPVHDVLGIHYELGQPTHGNRFIFRAVVPWKELSMKNPSRIFQSLMLGMLGVIFSFACPFAFAQRPPGSSGWYTKAQAANGSKVYQNACASCHGAQLQGGGGPALVGKQFWLIYGGKKVSTLWSNVHTEMPMSAPGSVSAKNSTNVMAFLLQKNGVAGGATPLDDTADLSKVLPPK
jgi:mono/diheme cytochrome c family protein